MFIYNLDDLEKKYLDLLNKIENYLFTTPYGHVKIQKRNGRFYYYQCNPKGTNGTYLQKGSARDEEVIDQLCMKKYYKQLLPVVKRDLAAVQSVRKKTSKRTIGEVYDNLPEGVKVRITGIEYSDQEYLRRWISTPYATNQIPFSGSSFVTKKGDRVRSKTELIIADKLYDSGIPYKYEKMYAFKEYGELFPDFTILNVRTRQVYIWEHFGMMGSFDYREKAFKKISILREFENSRGYRFLATFEDDHTSLDTKQIDSIIANYFV